MRNLADVAVINREGWFRYVRAKRRALAHFRPPAHTVTTLSVIMDPTVSASWLDLLLVRTDVLSYVLAVHGRGSSATPATMPRTSDR